MVVLFHAEFWKTRFYRAHTRRSRVQSEVQDYDVIAGLKVHRLNKQIYRSGFKNIRKEKDLNVVRKRERREGFFVYLEKISIYIYLSICISLK